MCFRLAVFALFVTVSAWGVTSPPVLDNGVASLPEVNCMEDRVRLTFKTQRPFQGRIFVKGMVDKEQCVNSYLSNTNTEVSFDLENGACNMRRTRMLLRSNIYRCAEEHLPSQGRANTEKKSSTPNLENISL
ncbi:hypothetical protein ANCCEY_04755 [Ancylostoma ceylanicum]|uniref:ZP domain-containing protein n=1 Tax=Ancylostoma ceylanicum TaxID=53326 RepID=A0A0D6LWD7_9BILA|nr:hypothetical protein ANCCEY_04755 [Ancylostoma ceylanicum]